MTSTIDGRGASWAGADIDTLGDRYVFVDWGPEFVTAHATALPDMTNPGLTFSLGAMVAEYVINRRAAAYLPARYVKPYLDSGRLHLVADAPRFPYPVWAVWRDDLDPDLRAVAMAALTQVTRNAEAESDAVIAELARMSEDSTVTVLGETPDVMI